MEPSIDAHDFGVAIIGAGAAGVLVARHLTGRLSGVGVAVIGAGHEPGRGVAYSTPDHQHRMNVPVRRLGVDVDGSDHLVRWLEERDASKVDPEAYIPRRDYGDYLADHLDATGVPLVAARATSLACHREGWTIGLEDGSAMTAGVVVLATGPPPGPGPVPLPAGPSVVADPWDPSLAERMAEAGEVLILGTGLTMVDVALTATARGATVRAVSRHGRIPGAHPTVREAPTEPFPLPPGPMTAAQVRRLVVVHCRTEPAGWPAAMDAARDRANTIWGLVPQPEQAKLLRRGFSAWTVHRHRMAPEVADRFACLRRSGAVRIERGTVQRVLAGAGRAAVHTSDGRCLRAPLVVSCTGPSADVGRTTDPLLGGLLTRGDIRLGPHRLGIAVDDDGRVLGPHRGLYAVGPLRRGKLVETTAIPEIRAQAVALAEHLDHLVG